MSKFKTQLESKFLEEISDLPEGQQEKLLKLLELNLESSKKKQLKNKKDE